MWGGPFPFPRVSTGRFVKLSIRQCILLGGAVLSSGWEKPVGNKMLFQWYFKFWSSYPTCLPLFTFQSPQVDAPCILSRSCSYVHSEKQVGIWLPYFIQYWLTKVFNFVSPGISQETEVLIKKYFEFETRHVLEFRFFHLIKVRLFNKI